MTAESSCLMAGAEVRVYVSDSNLMRVAAEVERSMCNLIGGRSVRERMAGRWARPEDIGEVEMKRIAISRPGDGECDDCWQRVGETYRNIQERHIYPGYRATIHAKRTQRGRCRPTRTFVWKDIAGTRQNTSKRCLERTKVSVGNKAGFDPVTGCISCLCRIVLNNASMNPSDCLTFHTPGFAHYSLAWSPFHDGRLAVASAANFGLVGNGRLQLTSLRAGGIALDKQYVRPRVSPVNTAHHLNGTGSRPRMGCTISRGQRFMRTSSSARLVTAPCDCGM